MNISHHLAGYIPTNQNAKKKTQGNTFFLKSWSQNVPKKKNIISFQV